MSNKGQSLIEALVALGAAVVIISAVAISVITAVNNADYSKIQNQATAYASSEMEVLHQQSRADWTTFNGATYLGTHCVDENGIMSLPSGGICPPPNTGNFKRQVDINPGDINNCSSATRVIVTVFWKDGRCPVSDYCHNTKLESCFTNINTLPTP